MESQNSSGVSEPSAAAGGATLITDKSVLRGLLKSPAQTLARLSSPAGLLSMSDIHIDADGHILISNPDIAREQAVLAAGRSTAGGQGGLCNNNCHDMKFSNIPVINQACY